MKCDRCEREIKETDKIYEVNGENYFCDDCITTQEITFYYLKDSPEFVGTGEDDPYGEDVTEYETYKDYKDDIENVINSLKEEIEKMELELQDVPENERSYHEFQIKCKKDELDYYENILDELD